jgi:protoporphyrinogen oxidase
MAKPQVVILGAGPAGVGAAFCLTRRDLAQVTVLERHPWVGGNAGSFELAGMRVDYGSHRLHPSCNPEVLQDIRTLLGEDLLDRPRHGRIRLHGRWIHFPLRPLDLALKLPPHFAMGIAADALRKFYARQTPEPATATFATVLEAGLGRTICQDFYFPYARKIWGLEPGSLSAIQARRRVSADSLSKMVHKVLSAVPGLKRSTSGRFFYPCHGFGQITEAYYHAAQEAGAVFDLEAQVQAVETHAGTVEAVHYEKDGRRLVVRADQVWSTIPITALARCVLPGPPPECVSAAGKVSYRAMILIYLVLEQQQFSEYDAHYFPEPDLPLTRISEPKNYRGRDEWPNLTILCAELPCAVDGPEWKQSDKELGQLACRVLATAELPVRAPVKEVVIQRLPQAYPIYRHCY